MRHYKQRGITVSGLIYTCVILAMIALMGMKLFPLFNEKTKVDFALEKVASQPDSKTLSKASIAKLISRQFEVSEIRRWRDSEFAKLLTISKDKSGNRIMRLTYDIRGPFFGPLDVVLNYDKRLELGVAP